MLSGLTYCIILLAGELSQQPYTYFFYVKRDCVELWRVRII